MPETVVMTDRVQIPWTTKINPLWWLVGPTAGTPLTSTTCAILA